MNLMAVAVFFLNIFYVFENCIFSIFYIIFEVQNQSQNFYVQSAQFLNSNFEGAVFKQNIVCGKD